MRTEIDFLDEKNKLIKKRQSKKLFTFGKIIVYLLIILGLWVGFFSFGVLSSGENLAKTFGNISLAGQVKSLISSADKEIAGENEDRINVLLLGIGGAGHEGPYLTDTIILASLKPSTKQVALISIPRDSYVPIPGYGTQKINHANAYGQTNGNIGGELASQTINQILGLPIHYYIRIDFAGFEKIIDNLGGITLKIENTLDDPYYPVKGKEEATNVERYEHLYIPAGKKHFDGDLALKYVRSRQALGVEGSDFARSRRQQNVLLAVKDKIMTFGFLANPYKVSRLMDTLSQHLQTNLQVWEAWRIYNLTKLSPDQKIINRVFDDSPNGLLKASMTAEGAFILTPKAGDFSEMQLVVKNIFNKEATPVATPIKIEIQNGTKIVGLAAEVSLYLQNLDYQVIKIGNAPTQDYQKTVIYNLKGTAAENIVKLLSQQLKAEIATTIPNWTKTNAVSANTSVLIILGQDQKLIQN